MDSQTTNSSKDEFSHYHKSAENMEKISEFFNDFFRIHIFKAFLYFLLMPEFITDYSANAIGITAAYIISQIILALIASYKETYMNKTGLSNIAISIMMLTDILSTIIHRGSIISICTIMAIADEIIAHKKTYELRKLKKLKGYPLFSELLDNPSYVFAVPNLNANTNTSIPANSNAVSCLYSKSMAQDSVKIPDIAAAEPEKISLEEMTSEKPAENRIFSIPFSADTPMEARILGNATVDYSIFNIQTEEMSVIPDGINRSASLSEIDYTDNRHKIINISKNKNNNL